MVVVVVGVVLGVVLVEVVVVVVVVVVVGVAEVFPEGRLGKLARPERHSVAGRRILQ